jgi:hypothetical protein
MGTKGVFWRYISYLPHGQGGSVLTPGKHVAAQRGVVVVRFSYLSCTYQTIIMAHKPLRFSVVPTLLNVRDARFVRHRVRGTNRKGLRGTLYDLVKESKQD